MRMSFGLIIGVGCVALAGGCVDAPAASPPSASQQQAIDQTDDQWPDGDPYGGWTWGDGDLWQDYLNGNDPWDYLGISQDRNRRYVCGAGETTLIDAITYPNTCGGSSLLLLRCVNGDKRIDSITLTCQ